MARPQWGPIKVVPSRPGLPFVFLNAAMTADGKIAPANRHFEPFGSRRDKLLLYELRTCADAIVCGARTLDLNPVKLGNGGQRYTRMRLERGRAAHPIRVIASGHASVNPKAEIFKHRFSPIIVLASRSAPKHRLKKLHGLADEIALFGEHHIDFRKAFRWLRAQWNVKALLSEGGGELNGALFTQGLVNELYLTVCPIILRGHAAPTLADGDGFRHLNQAAGLTLRARKRIGDEMFLIYRVNPRPRKGR